MTRLAEIQGHITSMGELQDIVGAMRSLSGVRVQEAQRALPGVRRYVESLAEAIGASLLLMPQLEPLTHTDRGARALVLCATEHGFVGGFNERLVEAAEKTLKPSDVFFVLGSRGAVLASEHGRKVNWTRPMAIRLAGVPDAINALVGELYSRIVRGEISTIEVMFGRYRQGMIPAHQTRPLLPFDRKALAPKQPCQPPLHNLEPRMLFEKLLAEYVFALLTEAAVESMVSENAARFAAMQATHDNVTRKLSDLRQAARQERQAEITSELLDLMTGAEAISGGRTLT